jgi:hypothetical protein
MSSRLPDPTSRKSAFQILPSLLDGSETGKQREKLNRVKKQNGAEK